MELVVIKLPPGEKGFTLLLRRWVVERSFGWTAHCRRLLHDFERIGEALADYHMASFV